MDYKLNLTPSPQDNRDFVFKTQEMSYSISYPEELDLRDELMPVRDQEVKEPVMHKVPHV